MSSQKLVDEICDDIRVRLDGVHAEFAVVIWLDGRPGDPKAMCVACSPGGQADLMLALSTAGMVIGQP